ncbi:hypothetical protein Scep_003504 [Stephania cephalantha]|uniref:Probable purine permease n=1 Tax=Stephania cephalantha TaxID=152367 RepID=A0AAP0KT80_9MAGN
MIGGPLTQRLYYVRGGNRKWLSCTLQSIAFPLLLIPLSLLYFRSRESHFCVVKCASNNQSKKSNTTSTHHHQNDQFFLLDPKPLGLAALIGLILGLSNYLYATSLKYLPVSTTSLLFSSQLAFTAVFARVLVKQRFTFYSGNAVVVMTMGAVVLGVRGGGEGGGDKGRYVEGFVVTLGGAAASGLVLPMVEMVYKKCGRVVNMGLVTQVQIVLSAFASLFCVVGMALNKDFQNIPREAKEYGLGEVKYYLVLVGCGVCWQLCFVGVAGIILCTSSLFAGVTAAFMLPFQEVAAVIVFHEKFTGEKGLSLALCLWGFISYFMGEYKKTHGSSDEATTSSKNDGDNV